jgi:hypothetical protein
VRDDVVDVDGRLVPSCWIEDVLALEQHPPGSPQPGYLIDLGWYPDSDPEGAYRLVLLRTWEDILDQLVSPDRFAIRERLERWMDQISRAKDRAQLERWLEADR